MIVNFVNRIYEAQYELREVYDSHVFKSQIESIDIVKSEGKFLRYGLICSRELDQPPLQMWSNIHDKELDRTFKVHDFIRNTDNTYTCEVDDIIEDTPDSLLRKHKLESEIIAQSKKVDKLERAISELKSTLKLERNKSIWQLIKERLSKLRD